MEKAQQKLDFFDSLRGSGKPLPLFAPSFVPSAVPEGPVRTAVPGGVLAPRSLPALSDVPLP